MKTNSLRMRGKIAALTLALCGGCAFHGHGGTVVSGPRDSYSSVPFWIDRKTGKGAFLSEYQQIYSAALFAVPGWITQVSFMSALDLVEDVPYRMTLGLAVTSKTPVDPGDSFVAKTMGVFTGTVTVHLTATPGDFDFLIPLTTPFYYDPTQGNLVLDVLEVSVMVAPLGNFGGDLGETVDSPNVGEIIGWGDPPSAAGRRGLVTQFTTAPVPEPGVAGLVLAGGVLGFWRIRSAQGRDG